MSFQLPDPYKEWSEEKLKNHCRKLCREIFMMMARDNAGCSRLGKFCNVK